MRSPGLGNVRIKYFFLQSKRANLWLKERSLDPRKQKAVSGTNIDLRKLQHGKTYRIKVPQTQGLILDAIKGIGKGIGKLFGIG